VTRTLTPERQQLRDDAIRLRQELGWSERRIASHLSLPRPTINRWVARFDTLNVAHNSVNIMDCVTGMAKLPHDSIDLVFADPPYNIGVDYANANTPDKWEGYYDECWAWFRAIYRILKPGGSFYFMHYPIQCADLLSRLRGSRFAVQSWITWYYPTNIGQSSKNWTRAQRTILFCTKGPEPAYFNGLADPQPYRNPTDKRIQENLKTRPGVTPYDVWEYNLVKNVSKDKTDWPNQLPVAMLERIIKVSCPEGGIVCDPFMGSGTTAAAAARNHRQWIGFDMQRASKHETERRLGEL
jgi:site-specific DNA-methyltransferase (adenine-specific)